LPTISDMKPEATKRHAVGCECCAFRSDVRCSVCN
jgi:hypothetical protein